MKIGITAVAALILLAAPAEAATSFSADIFTGFGKASGSVKNYDFGGAALVSFDKLQTQLGISDTHSSVSPFSFDLIKFDGDFFVRDRKGTVGLTIGQDSFRKGGASGIFTFLGDASVTSYGAFGEWYMRNSVTLKFSGGGYSGDAKGFYLGTDAAWYVTPDIALDFGYHYLRMTSVGNQSAINLGAEYMPWESLPLSLGLTYSHVSVSPGGSGSTYGLSLKYRFGTTGSLVARDRSGPISWNGALPI